MKMVIVLKSNIKNMKHVETLVHVGVINMKSIIMAVVIDVWFKDAFYAQLKILKHVIFVNH